MYHVQLCTGHEFYIAEGVGEHGEYSDLSVVQSQPPTSASEEQHPSNHGMINFSHILPILLLSSNKGMPEFAYYLQVHQ